MDYWSFNLYINDENIYDVYPQLKIRNSNLILDKLNKHNLRSYFEICVDGGVNDSIVKMLNVESVVSGSYILGAPNPIKNIMHLQTSGEYAQY